MEIFYYLLSTSSADNSALVLVLVLVGTHYSLLIELLFIK